jgi:hypothetical protein
MTFISIVGIPARVTAARLLIKITFHRLKSYKRRSSIAVIGERNEIKVYRPKSYDIP